MKRLTSVLVLVVTLFGLSICVSANTSRVIDDANLLSSDEISSLHTRCSQIADQYDLDVVIVTCDDLGGKTATAYADDYFDYNGYGVGPDHSGVLLLVSMKYRDWAVSTCGDGEDRLSGRTIDSIMESVLPKLSDGEYADAFDTYLDKLERELDDSPNLLISLVIGLAVAGVCVGVMIYTMNTARPQSSANGYLDGGMQLQQQKDIFLYSHTSRTKIERDSGSSSSSSSHRSSSGRSHGGSSGKF